MSTDVVPPPVEPPKQERRRADLVAVIFRFQSLFGLVAVFIVAVLFSPTRDGELVFLPAATCSTSCATFPRSGSSPWA